MAGVAMEPSGAHGRSGGVLEWFPRGVPGSPALPFTGHSPRRVR